MERRQRQLAKRKYQGPSAPLWCLSYGDMVTNMLCFFVMLMIFATFDTPEKTQKATRSLDAAISPIFSVTENQGASQRLIVGGKDILLMPHRINTAEIPHIVKRIKNKLQKVSMRDQLLVTSDNEGVKIKIPSKVLFQSGSAALKPGAEEVLEALVPIIGELNNYVRIDGHCDDNPINNPQFPTNWELSTARACTVLRFFTDKMGLDPSRFSAQGFGEYRPQVDNLTSTDREQNRRVEIMILTAKKYKRDNYKWE